MATTTKYKYCDNPKCDIYQKSIVTASHICRNCGQPLKLKFYQTYHTRLLLIIVILGIVGAVWLQLGTVDITGVKKWFGWLTEVTIGTPVAPLPDCSSPVPIFSPAQETEVLLRKLEEISREIGELSKQLSQLKEIQKIQSVNYQKSQQTISDLREQVKALETSLKNNVMTKDEGPKTGQ